METKAEMVEWWPWNDDEIPEGEENYPVFSVYYVTLDPIYGGYMRDYSRGYEGNAGVFLTRKEAEEVVQEIQMGIKGKRYSASDDMYHSEND
jgi:hypothetical protein